MRRDAVLSVSFSPCGTKLASGGGDPYGAKDFDIRIWSMETGACDQVLKAHTSVPVCMLLIRLLSCLAYILVVAWLGGIIMGVLAAACLLVRRCKGQEGAT